MTKEELIEALKVLSEGLSGDPEGDHVKADRLLLAFIDDDRVTTAFGEIDKWYA